MLLDTQMSTLYKPFEQRINNLRIEGIIKKIKNVTRSEISFSGLQKSYCVGIVDVVNSTSITAGLAQPQMFDYYRVFLNSMSEIVKEFGALVVKNIGDRLLYYFPQTRDAEDKLSLKNVLECCLVMIESQDDINKLMAEYKLPHVSYRVSSDYGRLVIAKSLQSTRDDIFGPTVNACSKINSIAMPNSIVIGGDLQQITKSYQDYGFYQLRGVPLGMKLAYPVYALYRTSRCSK